eukprot:4513181-Alexandrium_andersonii.AAC.1
MPSHQCGGIGASAHGQAPACMHAIHQCGAFEQQLSISARQALLPACMPLQPGPPPTPPRRVGVEPS